MVRDGLDFPPVLCQASPSALQQRDQEPGRVSPGRACATAGENGAERPGRAADTTTDPNDNGLIDGADKRLAQSAGHTCARLRTHTRHAHKRLASYQPWHQAPATSQSSLLLLLLPPVVFVLPERVASFRILDVRLCEKR